VGAGKTASPHRTVASTTRSAADATPASAQSTVSAASSAGGRAASRGGETTSAAVTATSQSAAASTSASAFIVAFADLPNFIADQAGSLSSAAAAPDSAPATNAAANPSPKAAEAVKELQISLDPADLGAMTLKLRLAGGKLSVTISVANPQTLAAIKDDSALISQRLSSNNQALDDLVIQQQNLASTTESAGAHAFANDSSAQDQPSEGEPQARRRPNASSRSASDSSGAFRDLTV
jgi:flagellar hook-length control protein FliK